MRIWQKLSVAFAAGAFGALANITFLVVIGLAGIIAAMGINASPLHFPALLYKQVAWGGLWGFIFVLPILARSWWKRGIVLGTLPALAALLIFFPLQTVDGKGPGLFGLNAGDLTFVLVIAANWVWGLAAAWWYARMTSD